MQYTLEFGIEMFATRAQSCIHVLRLNTLTNAGQIYLQVQSWVNIIRGLGEKAGRNRYKFIL